MALQKEWRSVGYPFEEFVLGAVSGAAVVLFFLLALWFHHKDSAQTPYRQWQTTDFFSKGMVWAFMMTIFCTILVIVGALTLGSDALAWSEGAVVGIVAILTIRWIVRQNLPQ